MKKFKLVRMAALGLVGTVVVSLYGSVARVSNKKANESFEASVSESFNNGDLGSQYIDYKYNVILAEDSGYSCKLIKAGISVGPLVGDCYLLQNGYHLYTPEVDKQGFAVPSISLSDGSQIFVLNDDEVLSCIGVTDEAYQMLATIDQYESQMLIDYNISNEVVSR